ncbi:MAG: flagellar export protein FliJ [Eubacterium sp.]|nr:flagellar export protein FliJ [Eubacterium sp.]
MAKFIFKLQSILDIKLKLESQAKIAYGQANAKLKKEEGILQMLVMRRSSYEQRAVELVSGTINIREIRENKQSIDIMKSKIRAQMMVVQAAEKQVEAARLKLNEVMIERKTFEKLRERAFEEFKQEVAYEENQAVNELVSYTYHGDAE